MEVTQTPTKGSQYQFGSKLPQKPVLEDAVRPGVKNAMVRNYRRRNRFYRNSKLSERQVLIILYACLTFAPNSKIAADAGVSEKTLKTLFRKYAEKLASSYSVRRYHLETLLAKGYINEKFFDHLANSMFQKSDKFWSGFEACVFRCPKMINFRATEKGLTEFIERYDPGLKTPRLDAQNALFVNWYARNTITTKRVPCAGCKYLNAANMEELYRNAFYTIIGEFYDARKLRRKDLKIYFLPALFLFIFYKHALGEIGVTYPYNYEKGLPKFETADELVHAVFPIFLKAAAEFMYDAIDSLESDPL